MTDLTIIKGKTFSRILRWESAPLIYKAITAVTKAGPVAITAASHGIVNGWRVAVVSVGGMRELKATNWPLRPGDFHKATYVDANGITLNDVNSTEYTAYTSGGFLVYNTAVSLASFTARMQVRATDVATGAALIDLTSTAGDNVINDTAKTITITISAVATAALTFSAGVYDLELASGAATPVVTRLLSGNIFVGEEVTR